MSVTTPLPLDENSTVLKIEGPLTINSAEKLQEVLAKYVSREPYLELDLSSVDTCDAAGLQLLCSLHKSAAALGKPLKISAVSEPFTTLAKELGFPVESLTLSAGQSHQERLPVTDAVNQGGCNGM